jgi:uncharacterized protein YndB with AHSA1/START domain
MNDKASTRTAASTQMTVVERVYRAQVEELWYLWTTKEGFESWWGPEGFRVDVHALEPRVGGLLHYDMIASAPEQIAAMKQLGRPPAHETRGKFVEFKPRTRLVLSHVIDFIPGVKPYESTIEVDFTPVGDSVRMVVTLHPMHDTETSSMQLEGFTSQLSKLDKRYGVKT